MAHKLPAVPLYLAQLKLSIFLPLSYRGLQTHIEWKKKNQNDNEKAQRKNVRTLKREPHHFLTCVPVLSKILLGFIVKSTLFHTPGSKKITEQKNVVLKQGFINREACQEYCLYSHVLLSDLAQKLRWLSVFLTVSWRVYVQLVTNQVGLHALPERLDYTGEK